VSVEVNQVVKAADVIRPALQSFATRLGYICFE
jgi:hypothetical protein